MKTAKKIALIYSCIAVCLVLMAGLFIWFFVSKYSVNVFYSLLEQKAMSVAMLKYEKDELPEDKYENLVLKSRENLAISEEMILDADNDAMLEEKLGKYLNTNQIQSLLQGKNQHFKTGKQLGCAIYYQDNEGNFAVLVTASNIYTEKINKTIAVVLSCILLFTSLILYFASRLYAIRILDNKEKTYQKQKLFINGASHEINNPLTAISGQCEIALLKDRSADEYKQTLQNIYQQTQRITDIIKNLLMFSHSQNGNMQRQSNENFLLSEILMQFKDENVSVNIENDFFICANRALLSLAIGNIVNNAKKFSQLYGVKINLNADTLTIEDKGIGIRKEDLPFVFDAFFRADNASAFGGHGIGLALSKSILDQINAKISVSSVVNQGTVFTVKFAKKQKLQPFSLHRSTAKA
ncbi:MAG: HAMP domain-containing histidine kinase [Bacteroidales bacterium]|nr:HAMP domain-containing histidine kinase [Bacteroidales bacterium]